MRSGEGAIVIMNCKPAREASYSERPCDICGEPDNHEMLGSRQIPLTNRAGTFMFRQEDALCMNCGFVFSKKIPDNAFLADYYGGAFTRNSAQVDIGLSFDLQARMSVIETLLHPGAAILEVGANDGAMLRALQDAGYDATGLDLIDPETEKSFEQKKIKKFDAIIGYYILEHIPVPFKWISYLKEFLKNDSFILMEVPDFSGFPKESLNPEHFSHFTGQQLGMLLERCGLRALDGAEPRLSRYFGTVGVGMSSGRPATPANLNLSEVLERSRHSYQTGMRLRSGEAGLIETFVAKILDQKPLEKIRVNVWGANEISTYVGLCLNKNNVKIVRLFDNADSKIGATHPGYSCRISRPDTTKHQDLDDIFFLCSPRWNQDFRSFLQSKGIEPAVIFEVPHV